MLASASLRPFLLFLAVIILIASRQPILLVEPRFWAEEGSTYFAYAFQHGFFESLFALHQGYFSLFANVSALAAHYLVPLEYAPFVTTYLAFAAMLVPFALVIFGRSSFWPDFERKTLVCLLILFTAPHSEMWLNTINSQFYLLLAAFLLLLEDTAQASKKRIRLYAFLLLIACLTGVTACLLAPFFLYKAHRTRHPNNALLAILAMVTAAIQLALTLYALQNTASERQVQFSLDWMIGDVFAFVFVTPIFGFGFGAFLLTQILAHWNVMLAIVLIALMAMHLCYFSRMLSGDHKILLVYPPIILSVFFFLFAMSGIPAPRYLYVPGVILMILIASNIDLARTNSSWRSTIASCVVLFGLTFGIWSYYGMYVSYDADWPKWQNEVARWRANETRFLRIHEPGWTAELPKNH